MDLRKLKTLIDLVSESNVSELEITEAEGKVRIVKSAPQAPAFVAAAAPAPVASVPVANTAPPAGNAVTEAPNANEETAGHPVKSPMVGTFYRAPNPESAPFVEVGSTVKVGDRLCIIEAMKILNEIESDRAGVVKAIQVSDGDAVEFGQVMFIIE